VKSILEPCHGSGIWHPDRTRRRIGNFSEDHQLHQIQVSAGKSPGLPAKGIGDGVYAASNTLSALHFATASLDDNIGLIYQASQISERLRHSALPAFETTLPKHKKFGRDQAATKRSPLHRT
jgi:hypothetical protein